MSSSDLEVRSSKLETIRQELRKYLESCLRMKNRSHFNIQFEAPIQLTSSEERAMKRQIDASHGDLFVIDMTFLPKRRRRGSTVTHISIKANRRRIPLRR
ncbi:MAG: hypothetical protein H6797_02770 [Candidatus Nomurabacteria bacterium]|nr:MAG: hypothetical protein H6797_02770 [Candidatus Nomurabacteria bacterium]